MSMKIPTGLENIGNTCFANSVFQWLLHTPEMMHLLSSIEPESIEEIKSANGDASLGTKVGRSLRKRRQTSFLMRNINIDHCCTLWGVKALVEETKKKGCQSITPTSLKDIITKVFGEDVIFGQQQDAHEFLVMLLHSLESSKCMGHQRDSEDSDGYSFDFNRNYDQIQLSDVFEGSFTSKITCESCKSSTLNTQKFQDISLVSSLPAPAKGLYWILLLVYFKFVVF